MDTNTQSVTDDRSKSIITKWLFFISLAFFFIAIAIISLVLTGKTDTPNQTNISEQHRLYALKAIEIADGYLDYELSAVEAYYQIESLVSREEELPDSEFGDPTHSKDSSVEFYTSFLRWEISDAKYDASSEIYNKIVEYRNEIAELIGEKKR